MKDPRIVSAFDSVEPDEAAKARMLESILAQAAPAEDGEESPEPRAAVVRYDAKEGGGGPRPRRTAAKRWAVRVAAVAASLVLVAGVGLFAAGGLKNVGFDAFAPEAASDEALTGEAPAGAGEAGYDYANQESPAIDGAPAMAETEEFNTEEYAAIEEHGFASVANQPTSTFSADVDTASYTNWRRMVNQGMALGEFPGGSIRVEEFLNYFDYDYSYDHLEGNDGGLTPFRVSATISDCPWNPDTKLLVLGLKANEFTYAESGRGSNLVFLIDVSGSMDDPNKLGLLQDSFAYLVEQLNPEDTISIVTYSGEERVVLDGMPASRKNAILDAVYGLRASGSTNGQAGLAMAYELAREHFIEGGNNRIILASDGDLNVGMTSEGELSDYVSEQRESGVYLTVLGFGDGNYSDVRMETIADDGNGNYHYIDCLDEARKVFGEDLCSTMVAVADDVKLQLEFNPAYVKGYRQVGYENRELSADEFRDDKVDAGEVGAGHTITVAYELVMADSPLAMSEAELRYGTEQTGVANEEWFALSVRWKNPGESEAIETSHTFGEEHYTNAPSADWTFAAAVIEYCMIATDSRYAGTATVGSVLEKVDSALADSDDPYRKEFHTLVANSSE